MKWLREGDKKRSKRELERLLSCWQDKLGMRDWAFKIERVRTMSEACFAPKSERFGILRCSCERDLIHELLNALFFRRNLVLEKYLGRESIIDRLKWKKSPLDRGTDVKAIEVLQGVYTFQLTNALLKLKYGDSK